MRLRSCDLMGLHKTLLQNLKITYISRKIVYKILWRIMDESRPNHLWNKRNLVPCYYDGTRTIWTGLIRMYVPYADPRCQKKRIQLAGDANSVSRWACFAAWNNNAGFSRDRSIDRASANRDRAKPSVKIIVLSVRQPLSIPSSYTLVGTETRAKKWRLNCTLRWHRFSLNLSR